MSPEFFKKGSIIIKSDKLEERMNLISPDYKSTAESITGITTAVVPKLIEENEVKDTKNE